MIAYDFVFLVQFIAVTLCVFLGLHYCFLYTQNRLSNILLGFIFLSLGFSVADQELSHFFEHPIYEIASILFNGPFIFITILLYYAFTLTNTWNNNKTKYQWVFLLTGIDIIIKLVLFFTQIEIGAIGESLYYAFISGFNLYVLYLILKQIDLHNTHIRNLFSSIENKQLNWLRLLVVINIGFLVFWLVDDILRVVIGENMVSLVISELSLYFTLLNVMWMGFASLRQPIIFETESEVYFPEEAVDIVPEIDDTDRATFIHIQQQIKDQKLFTDPTLSLRSLANMLNIRDRELSRIINRCYGNNFYHFINSFRIDFFKHTFSDSQNQHLSIMGLATEAGFKSKSTFYTAFKKMEGITPKEYATQ
jgi:AraC-like DNA-binding protein